MEAGKVKTKTIILADLEKNDLEEQMLKVMEEGRESIDAFFSYNNAKSEENKLHLISELYDLAQAAAGAIWILENGVSMNNEHIEKMEEYVETGRINNKAREEQR
jgi:hypothetical protein